MTALADLRRELATRGLDGFVVPRADEHQGEYVAPSARRLTFLTGFTGSAGMALVLQGRAAIFVDGRYTLQVRHEVDQSAFEIRHLIDEPPPKWVADALAAGQKLGFDPWLHTVDQVEALRAACLKAGAELVSCPDNPLDAVWADRPAPPASPVRPHDILHAGKSAQDKRAELAAQLAADRLDAVVLTDPSSLAWLLNLRGADVDFVPLALGFAIAHADSSVQLFLAPDRFDSATLAHLGSGITILPPAAFAGALNALGRAGRRVRIDQTFAPQAVLTALAGAAIDRGPDPCALPRACKNTVELAGSRAAHRRDGAAIVRFLAWLAAQEDIDELGAAERLESFRRQGELYRGPSFPTIAGAGPNGAIVHYHSTPATNRRLEPGQLFLLDSGGQYLDGTTDITRTIAIGGADAQQRRAFTLVLKGHIALAGAIFPAGTTGPQLDVLARQHLWRAGLDYDHGTGHGVGSFLSVHEGPQRIGKQGHAAVALMPGMILSNEPGYYKTGAFGIRIENLVVVTEQAMPAGGEKPLLGFDTLTLAPIDRTLIEPSLLEPAERAWINAYHARVAAELAPLLNPAEQAWLVAATYSV
ncbi:MAG: aminopeptidase P family protein [Alphaproteobacteria bacterium]|nr:aminopeptidase P family protein [Alphaproteobacteria bacterium]